MTLTLRTINLTITQPWSWRKRAKWKEWNTCFPKKQRQVLSTVQTWQWTLWNRVPFLLETVTEGMKLKRCRVVSLFKRTSYDKSKYFDLLYMLKLTPITTIVWSDSILIFISINILICCKIKETVKGMTRIFSYPMKHYDLLFYLGFSFLGSLRESAIGVSYWGNTPRLQTLSSNYI